MDLQTLGTAQIKNKVTKHYRAAEFLALLIRYPSGLPKQLIENLLFRGYVCSSAVPTLASRCRGLGISINFSASCSTYCLSEPIEADFIKLESAMRVQDWDLVWELYQGEFLPKSRSPYALSERERLASRLINTSLQTNDKVVLQQAVTYFSKEQCLWRCLADLGDDSAELMCTALDKFERGASKFTPASTGYVSSSMTAVAA